MSSEHKRHHDWRTVPLIVTLLALGASQAAFAARDTKTGFEVNGTQTALVTDTKSECSGGEPGCKEAKVKEKLKLKMRLGGDRDCNRAPHAEWRLQAVYLGGFNSATKPTAYGNFCPNPGHETCKVTADFDVDAASGLIIPLASGEKKIDFFNRNGAAYTIWYRVTATCVDGEGVTHGAPIDSDPRIINRGTEVN